MKFLKNYYRQLIFLIIGLLAGFFINRLPIIFEPKTNWVTLANFFLTIALALYLEFIVRPSFTNNRKEKDILIDQIGDIRSKIKNIHDFYITVRAQNPLAIADKSQIIFNFREVSNLIDLFKQADEYCRITKKTEISNNIFKEYLSYKKSITGKKFNNSSFYFDRLYWKDHDKAFKNIMKLLIHCIIDINKA